MGALVEWVLGEAKHNDLLLDLQPYLGGHGVLPVLPIVLLRLGHHRQRKSSDLPRSVVGKVAIFLEVSALK